MRKAKRSQLQSPKHRPLVRKAAEEAIVLLKNEPVETGRRCCRSSDSVKKIALIGPLADNSEEMTGSWGAQPQRSRCSDGERCTGGAGKEDRRIGHVCEGHGDSGRVRGRICGSGGGSKKADVTVLALGESSEMSGEAGSRAHLDLPGNQEKLLEAVAATGRPIVLLVFSGRPLVLGWAARAHSRHHGGVVSGHGGGIGDCRFALWRRCAERKAADEFSARGGAGAALLQPFPDRKAARWA